MISDTEFSCGECYLDDVGFTHLFSAKLFRGALPKCRCSIEDTAGVVADAAVVLLVATSTEATAVLQADSSSVKANRGQCLDPTGPTRPGNWSKDSWLTALLCSFAELFIALLWFMTIWDSKRDPLDWQWFVLQPLHAFASSWNVAISNSSHVNSTHNWCSLCALAQLGFSVGLSTSSEI